MRDDPTAGLLCMQALSAILDTMARTGALGLRAMKMPRRPSVSVIFADIVGFTAMSSVASPEEVLRTLQNYFNKLDALLPICDVSGGMPFPSPPLRGGLLTGATTSRGDEAVSALVDVGRRRDGLGHARICTS